MVNACSYDLDRSTYHEDAVEHYGVAQSRLHCSLAIANQRTLRARFVEHPLHDFLAGQRILGVQQVAPSEYKGGRIF